MRARKSVGLIVLLSISPVAVLSQERSDSPATKVAALSTHANTTEGLKQLLLEMRAAAQDGNQNKLATLVKQTEIPNCDAWLHKMYDSDKADSWMELCDSKALGTKEASMRELLKRLANEDGRFLTRNVNDSPQPGQGLEWGWLQAIKQPLDIYWVSWLPASETNESEAEPIGYFMFIEGSFRWESTIQFVNISRTNRVNASRSPKDVSASVTLDQRIEGTTYINRTAHFTLTVPSDWHVTDALITTTPNVVGTVAAPQGGAAIMIQRYDYAISPETASQIVESTFSKGFPGYRRLDEMPITIEGENTSSFVFQFEGPPGTQSHQPGKMLVVFIQNEGAVVGLMCGAPDPLFDQIEDTFRKIVTSYRYSAAP